MGEQFLKPKSFGANLKVKLDLSNYATNADLNNARGVDRKSFAKKLIKLIENLKQINWILIN